MDRRQNLLFYVVLDSVNVETQVEALNFVTTLVYLQ